MGLRYYLVTMHNPPGFYRADGTTVHPELKYADRKVIRSLSADGELVEQAIMSTSAEFGGVWMVQNPCQAVATLEAQDVFPFEDKASARTHAKRLGLKSFKYLQTPTL